MQRLNIPPCSLHACCTRNFASITLGLATLASTDSLNVQTKMNACSAWQGDSNQRAQCQVVLAICGGDGHETLVPLAGTLKRGSGSTLYCPKHVLQWSTCTLQATCLLVSLECSRVALYHLLCLPATPVHPFSSPHLGYDRPSDADLLPKKFQQPGVCGPVCRSSDTDPAAPLKLLQLLPT